MSGSTIAVPIAAAIRVRGEGAPGDVVRHPRALQRQVAEVDHQVRPGAGDVADDGVPVRGGLGGGQRQVRVRHDNHPDRVHARSISAMFYENLGAQRITDVFFMKLRADGLR